MSYQPWHSNYFSRKTKQYKLFHSLQVQVLFQLMVRSFSKPSKGPTKGRPFDLGIVRSILTIRPAYCQNPAYQTCFELPSTPVHAIHDTTKVSEHRKHRSLHPTELESRTQYEVQ
jgi:hypothetical protein